VGEKKIGRPTDNPKDTNLKIRIDRGTVEKLEECAKILEISKSEAVRQSIHQLHERLQEK